MSPVASIVTLGVLSISGFAVAAALPQAANSAELSIKDLVGASAATLMFAALVLVLRFVTSERAAATAERERADAGRREELAAAADERRELAGHVVKVTETFAETQAVQMRELREAIRENKSA